ncbi:MAG: enolase C-terminal domain-like protein [Bryobacteraceae bacterium]|nr:enolase C-terminal domain-like protein [Bryobacteraceae bacterium]
MPLNGHSRRAFLGALAVAPQILEPNSNDIRIEAVSREEQRFRYRTPYKFGGVEVDRVTLSNVRIRVRNRAGRVAEGFGSMPLGNVWSFPSRTMPYEQTLGAMQALTQRIQAITVDCQEYGHPVELGVLLEPAWLKAAEEVSRELALDAPIPKLCTLVAASPFDAALHDAYGKLHGQSIWQCYGRDYLRDDLGRFLGVEFRGRRLDEFVTREPVPRIQVYHSVGAADPLEDADLKTKLNDGLPETLPQWIEYNGLTHFKIKLNGSDDQWDRERILTVDRIAGEVLPRRGVTRWYYSLDFNERCPNVGYLIEVLNKVREKSPRGFEMIQYVEQPTARDLKADRANVMHEAAKLRPVVIDESLTDLEALALARQMGYTGAALKACKGQTQALLMAAAAQVWKMFLCVQDLTCPGAALIHSAALAAHVPGAGTLEANAREYVPAANEAWTAKFPGIFTIRDGTMATGEITGPGLGAVAPGE